MKPRLPFLAVLSLFTSAAGCLVPNVFCSGRTFEITGSLQTTPLGEDSQPLSTPSACATHAGIVVEFPDHDSLWHAVFEGHAFISDQGDLTRLYTVMEAIEEGAGSSLPGDDVQFYIDTVQSMINEMETECLNALTGGVFECTNYSAQIACTQRIVRPAEANYLNLDLGPTYVQPTWTATGEFGQGADGSCYSGDTDGGPPGGTDPGGDEGPGSSSGTSGADGTSGVDVTGTGDEVEAPFGDLDKLVHCNAAHTWCSYDPILVDNIVASLDQFHSDGAELRLLAEADAGYPGIRLHGLDRTEAPSTELAAAFGFQDGDVVRKVDGVVLKSENAALTVVEHVLKSGKATVAYQRGEKMRFVEITAR